MPHVSFIGNEEQRLVKRLQEGDKTAAREFYTRYGGSLAGVCVRYIADEEDVKDVIQNALVHNCCNLTTTSLMTPKTIRPSETFRPISSARC